MSEEKYYTNDITDELWREYDTGQRVYRIDNPVKLVIRQGGHGHRILDNTGVVHYVPFGASCPATMLRWMPRDPQNPIKF